MEDEIKRTEKTPVLTEMPEPWVYLPGACQLKNINYSTVCRKKDEWRQSNAGKEYGMINGHKAWRPATIRVWILQDDATLNDAHQKMMKKLP